MAFELESKDQLFELTGPELTPEEAQRYQPVARAEYEKCTGELEKAKAKTAQCKAVCDQNADIKRFLISKSAELTAKRDDLKTNLRNELFATLGDCDVEGISGIVRKMDDAVNFVDGTYSFVTELKAPADEILYLDSLANEAEAEHSAICAAARLSRTRTIAALGPVMEAEGGAIGVIGGVTERLKEQAKIAYKRIEHARNSARDARVAYERTQSARVSKGIVTSANTAHVFGR